MLVLSRRSGEQIVLPDLGIVITLVTVAGGRARVGIAAPTSVRVLRAELAPAPAGGAAGTPGGLTSRPHAPRS